MFRRALRRTTRNRLLRASLVLVLFLGFIDLLSISSSRPHISYESPKTPRDSPFPEKIFIASIHWNNEAIIRANWSSSIIAITRELGPKNVFVSIYESGSWDGTKDALRELDEQLGQLGVERQVILSERTHKDELESSVGEGWVETSRGRKEVRRIPYLANLRNKAMAPLRDMSKEKRRRYGKVLWINDVVFTVDDVLSLLDTRGGEYAAACSMDYAKPPAYYDTFALRDSEGHEAASSTYPFFKSKASRNAMIKGHPVPVQSCWNGMIAFDADAFTSNNPLQFRGVSDTLAEYHLEGSECCLVHYDNPITNTKGIWVNPSVHVAYTSQAYDLIHHTSSYPPSLANAYRGMWWNRLMRWLTTDRLKSRTKEDRVVEWQRKSEARFEAGLPCLINEMQVLVENGWAHV